jgi:hypothetical protein
MVYCPGRASHPPDAGPRLKYMVGMGQMWRMAVCSL